MPFSREGGRATTEDEAEAAEEEERKEEARARAEAEQAALEQLKEENPEAYERPAPSARRRRPATKSPEAERERGVMAKTSQVVRQQRGSKFKTGTTTAAAGAAARAPTCASSAYAASACARSPTRA